MHGNTCSCTYSNKQIHHQYNRIIQHYHSRRHVICVCRPDPESKKSSHKWIPSSESSPAWEGRGCPAPWAAMGNYFFQEHALWIPKSMFVGCTWQHLGHFFASLSIVGECWISVLQAVAVKLLRDASHDLALPPLPGIPVLQCQLSCLELFPKSFEPWDAPTTNGTCDSYDFLWLLQFRLHTVQMRNLETRRSAGGDHPPQVKKKTSRYFQWVRSTWSFKVSVSQQTFSYI